MAHGGHEARERRDLLLPALEAAAGRVGWVSRGALNHVSSGSRSRRRRPTASPRSTPCSRPRRGRRPSPTSATTSPAGSRARSGSARTWSGGWAGRVGRPRTAPRRGCAARASGNASAHRPPWCRRRPEPRRRSGPATGGDRSRCWRARVSPDMDTDAADPGLVPQAGDPSPAAAGPRGAGSTRARWTPTARMAATTRCGRSKMGPPAVIDEVTARTGGPWRRRVSDRPQVGRGRRPARHAPLPRVQRRRVRAGHVQGPRHARGRPVRPRRVDDHRRLRRWGRARLPVPPRRVPAARGRLADAIDQARRAGLLGATSRARGWSLRHRAAARRRRLHLRARRRRCSSRSRASAREPRNKPPFPVEVGLFGKPTAVNNVETLVNVPLILREGGPVYAAIGTAAAPPARSCSASPATSSGPGVYEMPFGATLGDLSTWRAASRAAGALQAILLGGAAGVFVGPRRAGDAAHVRGRRGRRARPSDPGVVMVFDDTADLAGALRADRGVLPRRVVRPMRPVPGRHGPPGGAAGAARRGARRWAARPELALFDDLGRAMRDASICGLGQTASSAIESAIKGGLVHFDAGAGASRDGPTSPASTPSCRPARRGCPRRRPLPRSRRSTS